MRRTLASWAILLGVVAFVCLPLSALAQRRGGVPFGLNWNRGRPATSALLSMSLTGNCEGTTPAGLTFTRTSTATCTRADGSLVTLAAGAPRLESQGLLVEGAATNLALRSQEMESAAWIPIGTPVMTANSWLAPDGTLTGDTVADDDGVAEEGTQQNIGTTAGTTYTFSCWMRANTASKVRMTFGGVLDCDRTLTASAAVYACTGTATGTSHQFQLKPARPDGATATGSVDIWGCQVESGPVATSYIPTQGTQVTRAAESYSVPTPAGLSQTEGCARMCVTPAWAGNAPALAHFLSTGAGGNARFLATVSGSGNMTNWDGVASGPTVAADHTAGVSRCWKSDWSASGNFLRLTREDNSTTSSKAFTTMPAFGATVGSLGNVPARVSSFVLGASPGACQ